MHAGLLHLLVPTELDSPPDWQSEFILSVRSMLHVCSSCLPMWASGKRKVTTESRRREDTEEEGMLGKETIMFTCNANKESLRDESNHPL